MKERNPQEMVQYGQSFGSLDPSPSFIGNSSNQVGTAPASQSLHHLGTQLCWRPQFDQYAVLISRARGTKKQYLAVGAAEPRPPARRHCALPPMLRAPLPVAELELVALAAPDEPRALVRSSARDRCATAHPASIRLLATRRRSCESRASAATHRRSCSWLQCQCQCPNHNHHHRISMSIRRELDQALDDCPYIEDRQPWQR